jgi:XTP/dITP diphosphohydrolase
MMARLLSGRVVVATHNPGKLAEMRDLLGPFGIDAVSAGELGLPEPDETGTTFAENAAIKAHAAAQASGLPALADDSGVCVEALDGAPGLFSARWAGPAKDFEAAMGRIERELALRGATTPERRRGHFVSRCSSHGRTARSGCSRAGSGANSFGRHAATAASATTRCSPRRAHSHLR